MTDRELLESAARADGMIPREFIGNQNYMDGVLDKWRPLEDDGDAFRLGVKFRVFGTDEFLRFLGIAYLECAGQDETAMWRRAIVLTVVAIGEKVK